ncbi:MAG: hypothetical protein OEU92_25465 [Alphaproteobacteria bacterium]|nr:hypothetical protein [Alphaproteobacteria bacterium]
MTSLLLLIVVALATFFFADSIFTPILLLLWKKGWLLLLKIQALFTKKNLLQALIQSLLLTAKALLRLINKTVTAWILPLLMTRRQRYRLHHAIQDVRRWVRFRLLRGWVRWRRQPRWLKLAVLLPAIAAMIGSFVAGGFLLAAVFGVTFIVPWIGGLPVVTVLFLRRQIARAALYLFESVGLGPVVNKVVDGVIDLVWWRTPEPMQRRFDAWWRRFRMRLRRWVIGPRRKVVKRVAGLRFKKKDSSQSDEIDVAETPDGGSTSPVLEGREQRPPPTSTR